MRQERMYGKARRLNWCCPGHDPMNSPNRGLRRKWIRVQRQRGKKQVRAEVAELRTRDRT